MLAIGKYIPVSVSQQSKLHGPERCDIRAYTLIERMKDTVTIPITAKNEEPQNLPRSCFTQQTTQKTEHEIFLLAPWLCLAILPCASKLAFAERSSSLASASLILVLPSRLHSREMTKLNLSISMWVPCFRPHYLNLVYCRIPKLIETTELVTPKLIYNNLSPILNMGGLEIICKFLQSTPKTHLHLWPDLHLV